MPTPPSKQQASSSTPFRMTTNPRCKPLPRGNPSPSRSSLTLIREVIRRYGILNDQIKPGDAMLFGIPYPGAFVCNASGEVTGRFFHDSYKKRDSPEILWMRRSVILAETIMDLS